MASMMQSALCRARTSTATPTLISGMETTLRIHHWFSTKIEAEKAMEMRLETQLEATHVKVVDISGGCGSMYNIEIVSPRFVGQTRVKQHRMVNEALKTDIQQMHGLTIKAWTPEQYTTISK